MTAPLDGRVLAGPLATMTPADLGEHTEALRAWLSDTSGAPLPSLPRGPGAAPAPGNG